MLTIMALAVGLAAGADEAAQARRALPPLEALEPAFSNTLVTIHSDGRRGRVWLSRDGGYRGQGRTGNITSGVWNIKGDNLCMRQRRPIPLPITYCTPIVAGEVGAQWPARSATGESIIIELVAGRGP